MKKLIKWLFRFSAKVLGIIPFWLFFRTRYYNESEAEKSRPLKGPAIVISNHQSIIDYFVLLFTFPFRKQRFLVSEALYQNKIPGFMSKMMDNIVVHRERSDLSFMAEAEKTLKNGGVVTIFPEGHLVKTGKLDVFKPVAVYLALRTGAPIVPTYNEAHYGSLKRTRLIIGKKIYLKDYCEDSNPSPEKVKELCEMLRDKTNKLNRTLSLYKKYCTRNKLNTKTKFFDFVKILLWLPTKIFLPTKFHYQQGASKKDFQIKDRSIIASKHYSYLDPPLLCMHYFSRRVKIVIADDARNQNPWLTNHLNTLVYHRTDGGNDTKCFLEIINFLKADGVIGIYPEGKIESESKGNINSGAAYFAMMTNSPIRIYWMVNKSRFFRINHVMIGKTIYPDKIFKIDELTNRENVDKLNQIINDEIEQLIELGKPYKKIKN